MSKFIGPPRSALPAPVRAESSPLPPGCARLLRPLQLLEPGSDGRRVAAVGIEHEELLVSGNRRLVVVVSGGDPRKVERVARIAREGVGALLVRRDHRSGGRLVIRECLAVAGARSGADDARNRVLRERLSERAG